MTEKDITKLVDIFETKYPLKIANIGSITFRVGSSFLVFRIKGKSYS
jgi:hypothetical protein